MAISSIDMGKCIKCGICIKACAVDVIRRDEQTRVPIITYPEDCMLCDMCK